MIAISAQSQIVTLDPSDAGPDDAAKLIFDASVGAGELVGASKVYVHHGIVVASPNSEEWEYVIGNWGADDGVGQMTKVDGENDKWEIEFSPNIRDYFGAAETESVYRISAVFRSADGSTKATMASGNYDWGTVASNGDFFIDLNVDNYLILDAPTASEIFLQSGEAVTISATASGNVTSMKVLINNGTGFEEKASVSSGTSISYDYTPSQNEDVTVKVTATINGENLEAQSDHSLYLVQDTEVAALPAGLKKGINYDGGDPTKATLVLEVPGKSFVYVLGDFNSWQVSDQFQMKKTADGELFWLELSGLSAGQEYVFQYWMDDGVKVGDPYAEKVADPWNDQYITADTYPNLPSYSQTDWGMATVLQTDQTEYTWAASEDTWQRPDLDHAVIYELLVRDFIGTHSWVELADTLSYLKKLGVDAIELMPFNEFEGNESWGYNPAYYFAPDKYYGTKDELKYFIERAHQEGMAVIMDMVLNHAYGQNPMVQMYLNRETYKPTPDNPWFNEEYVTSNPDWAWGYDFNHESAYTKAFIDSVNAYWINEYHVDGYRFDFTKGFTQESANFDGFQQGRIDILKRMADEIWDVDPAAYIILEHWSAQSEEDELANYGMKLWRNRVHNYYDAIAGKNLDGSFSDMDDLSHVTFMDSHDEQRVAYMAANQGLASADGSYDIKADLVMFERAKQAAAFALLFPGPKMIWQFDELGYDIDIDFKGRVGNKPLPWGIDGLGYYENEFRQKIYEAYQGILDVRVQIDPAKMIAGTTNHQLSGEARRLVFDTDNIDLVVIGNFGVSEHSISPAFTESGSWFDYFSGEEITVTDVNADLTLAAGEWHIYTSERISDGLPSVVETFRNPVSISPYPFTQEDEITITFDAKKAFSDGTNGLEDAAKVYLHSGVVLLGAADDSWSYTVGTLTDDGVGEMTETSTDIWEITLTPQDYYPIGTDEEIIEMKMYFRDASNTNVGKGFRDLDISINIELAGPYITIEPPGFQASDEITITFNTAKGNRALSNANKVYMHSSVDMVESETPWLTAWDNVVGNWGMDDGVGEMTQSTEDPTKWSITITPTDYYGIGAGDRIRWIAAVFRNANGSQKGTGTPGEIENGIIDSNLDFFIRNLFVFPLSADETFTDTFRVYPNPARNELFIENSSNVQFTYTVIDMGGKSVTKGNSIGETIINVANLEKGMYFLQLTGAQREVIRFIKK